MMASSFDILRRFEEQFSYESATGMMKKYWHYSLYISVFYVVSIFAIQHYMQKRENFDLRRPLFLWSLFLAIFSAHGFWMCGFTLLTTLYNKGWKSSVCDEYLVYGRYGLWSFLFCFSKAPELIDTYFIVLRKQKLIFLHWYHHITVFIYCWFHYANIISPAQWFISMNYFVHSIMYFYYAVRASGLYRPPLWINIFITSLQLLQMVIGVSVNMYVYFNMTTDPQWYCDGRVETSYFYVYVAFAMYLSYFILFSKFFYTTYMGKHVNSYHKNYTSTSKRKEFQANCDSPHTHYTYWNKCSATYSESDGGVMKHGSSQKTNTAGLASTYTQSGLMNNIGMVRH